MSWSLFAVVIIGAADGIQRTLAPSRRLVEGCLERALACAPTHVYGVAEKDNCATFKGDCTGVLCKKQTAICNDHGPEVCDLVGGLCMSRPSAQNQAIAKVNVSRSLQRRGASLNDGRLFDGPPPPPLYWLFSSAHPQNPVIDAEWVFLHIGKSGGGTVGYRGVVELGGLEEVHVALEADLTEEKLDSLRRHPKVVLAVRDPVDRFESAFNWALVQHCAEDDARIGVNWTSKGLATQNPDKFCQNHTASRIQSHLLHVKYGSNVSKLAEALCDNSRQVQEEAAADVKNIYHMASSIEDWMRVGEVKSKNQTLALVMEPGFDFAAQIEAGFAWMLTEAGAKVGSSTDSTVIDVPVAKEHSSSKRNEAFPGLTEVGAGCLAKFYAKDYEDIVWFKANACHGTEAGACQAALQSMIDRQTDRLSRAQ